MTSAQTPGMVAHNWRMYFAGKTAVLTGAASGFGFELSQLLAQSGMNVVMVDVEAQALQSAVQTVESGLPQPLATLGDTARPQIVGAQLDVADEPAMQVLAAQTLERFGAVHLLFNNAGVGTAGLIWEASAADWDWVMGVNLKGVVNGIRCFVPAMLDASRNDAAYRGHIVNTASMAGLVNMPNMGVYNVSKHAVVSLSETLYQDLALVTDQITASVLCPYFVSTGIAKSQRNRPGGIQTPTASQLIGQAMMQKAVSHGRVTAAEVAHRVAQAVIDQQFYIYSHPQALDAVAERMRSVIQGNNPPDAFSHKPEIGTQLREALRVV